MLCSQRWRCFIQSAKTRPGADYGSDHEALIAKFRPKLKKVGKTTRPFTYDLNPLLHVEVMNKFKGLDLVDRMSEEAQSFVTLYRRKRLKSSPRKEMQEGEVLV